MAGANPPVLGYYLEGFSDRTNSFGNAGVGIMVLREQDIVSIRGMRHFKGM